jgi:hypothetical protein
MTDNTNQATAEADKSVSDNLSFEELIARRIGQETAPEETEEEPQDAEEPEETEPASQDDEEEVEEAEEESEEESEESKEQSDIDLLNLTPEQIQDLAKKGKSRLLQRIGELTAQKRSLEEKLAAQPQMTRQVEENEIPEAIRKLNTFENLKEFYDEMTKTLESTDEILDEHEDYGPDDIITVGDKEFTKRQIRKANRNAKEALTKFIPAQQQQLIKVAQFGEMSKQYTEAAKKEVPEIQDEESEIGKNYKALVEDPLVARVKSEIPEIGMQIEYILAHAARSIFGKKAKAVQAGAGNKLKVSPPASPVGSGAAKAGSNTKAKAKDAYSRFESTGSVEDWVASRIAKLK